MHTSNYIYHHKEQELHGFLAYDDSKETQRPAVIVVHDWSGRNEFACEKAKLLAKMGYIGFSLDMFGQGRIGETNDEKMALINPLMGDRSLLQERISAALDALVTMPEVDINRIAVMGFCFGGLCALDLARSGADIKGAISFHGLLNPPSAHYKPKSINAKILVLHGFNDPMATPNQLNAFCNEMTESNADWQVHVYGNVQHAFTNPKAHDEELGLIYDPLAAKRAFQAMDNFLKELFC